MLKFVSLYICMKKGFCVSPHLEHIIMFSLDSLMFQRAKLSEALLWVLTCLLYCRPHSATYLILQLILTLVRQIASDSECHSGCERRWRNSWNRFLPCSCSSSVAQPCVSDDRLWNGFHMCLPSSPCRSGRGQRAFGVIPVRPSAGKCADIRALHFRTGGFRWALQWRYRRSWVCIDRIKWVHPQSDISYQCNANP